jgi:hypothetical protein
MAWSMAFLAATTALLWQGENKSKVYVVFAQPPATRGAVLWEIEGGKIQVGI